MKGVRILEIAALGGKQFQVIHVRCTLRVPPVVAEAPVSIQRAHP